MSRHRFPEVIRGAAARGLLVLASFTILVCPAALLPESRAAVEEAPAPASPLEVARSAESRRDWRAALEAYDRILASDKAAVPALAGRSRCLLRLEDFRSALEAAERAIASRPADEEAMLARAEANLRAGNLELARDQFTALVGAAPGMARGHLGLGRLLIAAGDVEKGIEALVKAHEITPDDPEVLLKYAGALARRGEIAAALQRYLDLTEGGDPEKRQSVKTTIDYYKALGERPVWVLETRPARCEIPLWPLARTPGRPEGYVIELRASGKEGKGDRKIRCLFDTGAAGLFLSRGVAERLGLEDLSQGAIFGGGGGGRHETSRALLKSLRAEDVKYRDAAAIVASGSVDTLGRYEGIIGADVFDSFRITMDLPGRRLIIEDPEAAGASPGRPPARREASGIGGEAVQVWRVEGQLLVRVGLNQGRTGLMMVDTGASRTVLGLGAAEGLEGISRRPRDARTYGFGGQVERVEDILGLDLAFAGLTQADLPVLGIDLSQRSRLVETEISGYLGLDVLRNCVLVFEPGLRRLTVREHRG
jgi:predicted aspartyl protease